MSTYVVLVWIVYVFPIVQATSQRRLSTDLNCSRLVECSIRYNVTCSSNTTICTCLQNHKWTTLEERCVLGGKLGVDAQNYDVHTLRECLEWLAVVLGFICICSIAGRLLRLSPLPTSRPVISKSKVELDPPPTYEEIEKIELPSYWDVTKQKVLKKFICPDSKLPELSVSRGGYSAVSLDRAFGTTPLVNIRGTLDCHYNGRKAYSI